MSLLLMQRSMLASVVAALVALTAARPVQPAPHALQQRMHKSDIDVCGYEGTPACISVDPDTNFTIHSCVSDLNESHATVGAVPSATTDDMTSVVYMCEQCGQPYELACECTYDNPEDERHESQDYVHPCSASMSHWSVFQPHYVAVTAPDGFDYCIHNDTDTPNEIACGTVGYEACLSIKDGSYSCMSPNPAGEEIIAFETPDNPNAPFMCVVKETAIDDDDGLAAKAKHAERAKTARAALDAAKAKRSTR